jgi:hypothetical protein
MVNRRIHRCGRSWVVQDWPGDIYQHRQRNRQGTHSSVRFDGPTRVLRVGAYGCTVMVAPVGYACVSRCRRTGDGRIVDPRSARRIEGTQE